MTSTVYAPIFSTGLHASATIGAYSVGAIAANENAGLFDTVDIFYSSMLAPLEIYGLAVTKFS